MSVSSSVSSEVTLPMVSPISSSVAPVVSSDIDKKLTREEAMVMKETEKEYNESLAFIKDTIAPAMMRIDATKLQIGDTYIRTIFTYAYPDVLE